MKNPMVGLHMMEVHTNEQPLNYVINVFRVEGPRSVKIVGQFMIPDPERGRGRPIDAAMIGAGLCEVLDAEYAARLRDQPSAESAAAATDDIHNGKPSKLN